MTRKDTIIIAAVINTALLLVLFISAKTTKMETLESKVEFLPIREIEQKPVITQASEIEEMLKGFSEEKKGEKPIEKLDFSQQLQAMTDGDSKERNSESKDSKAATKTYTVKAGDNPWSIALKNHMKLEDLLKLNNLDGEKARHLKPGDKLTIR